MRTQTLTARVASNPIRPVVAEIVRRKDLPLSRHRRVLPPQPEFLWESRENEKGKKCLHVHAFFISDLHLGTRHSRPKWICRVLENVEAENLFAIGDVIDLDYMRCKRTWNFAPAHRQVLGHLFRKHAYIFGGNHEAPHDPKKLSDGRLMSRGEWLAQELYGMPVLDEMLFRDPKGRIIKVEHSDQFDDVVLGRLKGFWYALGDFFHNPMADFDTLVQEWTPWEHFSASATAKKIFKTFINQLGVEKEIMRRLDADPTIDAYIGGHTHEGGLKKTPGGKMVMNSGHCTVHAVQAAMIDRNGVRAFVSNWYEDHCDVVEENGSRYKKYYKEFGLSCFPKPTPVEDHYMQRVDATIERLAKLAPPRSRRTLLADTLKGMGGRKMLPSSGEGVSVPSAPAFDGLVPANEVALTNAL